MSDPTVIGTYNPAEPAILDRMRGAIGDIGPEFLVGDATYLARLGQYTDWRITAASVAEQIALMLARDPNSVSISGEVSVGYSDRAAAFRHAAARLRAEVAQEETETSGGMRIRRRIRADRYDGEYRGRPWYPGGQYTDGE